MDFDNVAQIHMDQAESLMQFPKALDFWLPSPQRNGKTECLWSQQLKRWTSAAPLRLGCKARQNICDVLTQKWFNL